MNNPLLNLIIFGPPGSGKGTQAVKIAQQFNLKHLSTGDLLRGQIKNETKLGLEAKAFMDQGELVPDTVVIGMIQDEIKNRATDIHGFIFDGFPRTIAQAESLDNMLAAHNETISLVLSLKVGEEEIVDRLLARGKDSGRADDADEATIRNRIKVYHEKTGPVEDYYNKQSKVDAIAGEGEIQSITEALIDAITVVV